MILIGRIGNLSLDLIDLDEIGLHTLEDHGTEDGLLVGYKSHNVKKGTVTYTLLCDLEP